MKIYIQNQRNTKSFFPRKKDFVLWLYPIFQKKKIEITIRIVDLPEIQNLNCQYRNKNIPTNVLSFPSTESLYTKHYFPEYIGDIILCAEYINQEANNFKKNILEHWAHMVIHSALHLLHYTHNTKKEKQKMQKFETIIMMKLGYHNPYA